jgi:hypothetical protein
MNVVFTGQDGQDLTLNIPVTAEEITYGQFCDYQQAEAAFFEVRWEPNESKPDLVEAALIDAVAIIAGPHVHDLPFSTLGESGDDMIRRGYQIGFDSDLSVMAVYAHLTVLFHTVNYHGDLKPDSLPAFLVIEHGGKSYRVIGQKAARVMTDKAITAGEAIEASEYRRRHSKAVAARVQDGSALDFTLGLSEFAILVRRPGEQLPADEEKRDAWLVERRKLLADLSLPNVLKVRFFLIAALLKLAQGGNTSSLPKARPALIGSKRTKTPGKLSATVKRLLK